MENGVLIEFLLVAVCKRDIRIGQRENVFDGVGRLVGKQLEKHSRIFAVENVVPFLINRQFPVRVARVEIRLLLRRRHASFPGGADRQVASQIAGNSSAYERLIGQAVYYSKRCYGNKLIVLVVGKPSEKYSSFGEVQDLLASLGIRFVYKEVLM